GDKGSSPALLISTMEQPFPSINALVLTLFRLAESCIFKWFGYNQCQPTDQKRVSVIATLTLLY
ncbi:MAG: hypothetical protein ACPGUG_14195, partial [Pseudoalteromonas marina]